MEIDKILEAAYPYIEWMGIEDSQFRLFALLALSLLVIVILFFMKEKAGYKLVVFLCLLVGIAGVGYLALSAPSSANEAHFDDEWKLWAREFGERCSSPNLDQHNSAVRELYGEYKPIVNEISSNNGQVIFGLGGDYSRVIAVNPLEVAATNIFFNAAGGIMEVACVPNSTCASPVQGDQAAPTFVFQSSDCAFVASSLLTRAVDPTARLDGGIRFMDFNR
jgi:hypothetical protein